MYVRKIQMCETLCVPACVQFPLINPKSTYIYAHMELFCPSHTHNDMVNKMLVLFLNSLMLFHVTLDSYSM